MHAARATTALVAATTFFALLGCSGGLGDFTLPSKEPDPLDGRKLKPGVTFDHRTREPLPLFPQASHGFPVPEFAITSDQCDELDHGGSIGGPDCITDRIKCGDTIIGHTVGGVNRYDSRFYESHFCTPRTSNHDSGDERVFALHVPDGDYTAVVTLDSPCADLDLAAMWPGTLRKNGTCPTKSEIFDRCEMWPKDGTKREQVRLVTQKESIWYIVVEGKGDEEGLFALTVQCRRGLM